MDSLDICFEYMPLVRVLKLVELLFSHLHHIIELCHSVEQTICWLKNHTVRIEEYFD